MRYLVLLSAVVMQICLGATYSWSVYVQPLKTLTGLAQGPVQLPFSLFYFAFPATMMIAGHFLPRMGPRKSAVAGGLLFGGGWLVAGLGSKSFWFTVLGIGGLAGMGAGMAYIVPIAVCISWFPKSKGLVTGIAVAGFGGGAALVSQVGGHLISGMGMTPFQTFFIFGGLFSVLISLSGSLMHFPPGKLSGKNRPARTLKPGQVVRHPDFYMLYASMFMGLAAGFAVNANLKELYQGAGNGVSIGVTAVSVFALANAAGRVIWGAVFDRISASAAIQANLISQALVLAVSPFLATTALGFWALAFIAGFNYGGVLVIYVSSASRAWGAAHIGQVYGWLFTSNIPASLSPILAGLFYDRFHTFNGFLFILSGLLIAAAGMVHARPEPVNRSANSEN